MTERMEPLAPKVFKALLGMMEQTVLKAPKEYRGQPEMMEPMALQGRKESKAPLALMEMTEPPALKVPLDKLGPKAQRETTGLMVLRVLKGLKVRQAHKAHKVMPSCIRILPPRSLPHLPAHKGHRVCRAIPAHRGHKALPELLAHRVQPLFIQTLRSRS